MTIRLNNIKPSYMSDSEISESDIYLQESVLFEKGRKYLIRAMEESSREKLLHHAYEFQLALVSSSKLSSEDFSKLQKECKELFADLEGSLRPWLGRSSEDRHTKDVGSFKEQWKELMGFDPDDLEAKAKCTKVHSFNYF